MPSWNDGAAKRAVVSFVEQAVREVPPAERIAVFDNDGTLWSEQPSYFQSAFVLDRVKTLAGRHPEWKTQEPFASALAGDMKGLAASGEKGLMTLVAATHAGMNTEEFSATVAEWLKTARHPRFKRPYTDLVYQPMLELLAYLRAKGFKTFIVSGGGIEFLRVFAERVYGIPPEQVVGSSGKLEYALRDGKPVLLRLAEVAFVDDKAGKPVGIQQHIGRRPVAAFGNSDGDQQMLEWTTLDNGRGPRFALIVHHDDAEREWAYDRGSPVGALDRAWEEAKKRGWTVVSMKRDWRVIYPFEKK